MANKTIFELTKKQKRELLKLKEQEPESQLLKRLECADDILNKINELNKEIKERDKILDDDLYNLKNIFYDCKDESFKIWLTQRFKQVFIDSAKVERNYFREVNSFGYTLGRKYVDDIESIGADWYINGAKPRNIDIKDIEKFLKEVSTMFEEVLDDLI